MEEPTVDPAPLPEPGTPFPNTDPPEERPDVDTPPEEREDEGGEGQKYDGGDIPQ
jgi:hypothetical protein